MPLWLPLGISVAVCPDRIMPESPARRTAIYAVRSHVQKLLALPDGARAMAKDSTSRTARQLFGQLSEVQQREVEQLAGFSGAERSEREAAVFPVHWTREFVHDIWVHPSSASQGEVGQAQGAAPDAGPAQAEEQACPDVPAAADVQAAEEVRPVNRRGRAAACDAWAKQNLGAVRKRASEVKQRRGCKTMGWEKRRKRAMWELFNEQEEQVQKDFAGVAKASSARRLLAAELGMAPSRRKGAPTGNSKGRAQMRLARELLSVASKLGAAAGRGKGFIKIDTLIAAAAQQAGLSKGVARRVSGRPLRWRSWREKAQLGVPPLTGRAGGLARAGLRQHRAEDIVLQLQPAIVMQQCRYKGRAASALTLSLKKAHKQFLGKRFMSYSGLCRARRRRSWPLAAARPRTDLCGICECWDRITRQTIERSVCELRGSLQKVCPSSKQ